MIEGSCHCGAVRLSLPEPPEDLGSCNCSICRRLGGLWGYYRPDQVEVSDPDGRLVGYVQGDADPDHLALRALRLHDPLVADATPLTSGWASICACSTRRSGSRCRAGSSTARAGRAHSTQSSPISR